MTTPRWMMLLVLPMMMAMMDLDGDRIGLRLQW
jgi:hypothetical protein